MSEPITKRSLKTRVLKAGSWVIIGQVSSAVIRLGGNLLLTRLLVPEAFGLMAIVYVLMTGFLLFSDIGLAPNVTQSKRGEDPDFLNTAWVLQIIRGALIWVVAMLAAVGLHFAAGQQWLPKVSVYADPMLPMVVAVYSATQFIGGFYPTRLLVAGRRFALARVTQLDIAQQLIGLVIMAVWAWLSPSIWALVGGTIIVSLLRLPLYKYFLPGLPNHWRWDPKAFREIIGFGKWVFLSSIMGFLVMTGDRLILGALVDTRLLGIYSISFLIASFPKLLVTRLMGKVAFPALSEVVRNNPANLRQTYYKFRLYFDLAILSSSGMLFASGSKLIELLYDSRYHDAGWIVEVLAIGLVASRFQLADRCYMALGKPRMVTPVVTIQLLSMYLLVPIAFWKFGFEGAIWAIALNEFVGLPLVLYFKIKMKIFDLRNELKVLPAFFVGMAAGTVLVYLSGPLRTAVDTLRHISH